MKEIDWRDPAKISNEDKLRWARQLFACANPAHFGTEGQGEVSYIHSGDTIALMTGYAEVRTVYIAKIEKVYREGQPEEERR